MRVVLLNVHQICWRLKMRTSAKLGILAAVTFAAAGIVNAAPVTYYNANGFESFANGNLEGQTTGGTPTLDPAEAWAPNPTGTANTAVVQAANGVGGTKGVHLDHPSNSGSYRVTPLTNYITNANTYATNPTDFPNPPFPGNRLLHIDWSMKVNQSNAGVNQFGPLFGVEAYIARLSSQGVKRIGALYVDGTDGSTNYPGATAFGPQVTVGSYHNFSMIFDWATETYDISIDGVVPAAYDNLPWENPQGLNVYGYSNADFADADIMVAPFAGDISVAASADFDNYNVYWTAVPEPMSLGLVGGVVILLGRRR